MSLLERLSNAFAAERPDGVGVVDWSIYLSAARRQSLGVKDRQTGNPHAPLALAESRGASYLLVWEDGLVSRGSLERRQLEGDSSDMLAFARAAAYDDPDAAWVLGPAEFPAVELYHPATAAIAKGDTTLFERRLARVREVVAAEDVRTWSGSFSASAAEATVATSKGLRAEGQGTSVGWYVSFNGEIGTGHTARVPESEDDFDARLDRLTDVVRHLGTRGTPPPAGVMPVLLHPRVVDNYVLGTLFHHLDGATVAHGESRFDRAAFGSGTPVVRDDISLTLDPLVPLKSGSYRFTAEGLPAKRCSFVEGGALVRPVTNLKYARRLGLEPSPTPYSMDSLTFAGASASTLDEALAAMDTDAGGVLVLSVLGVHTQDSASGDFSLSAPQALHTRRGALGGRLRGTISGNLFELLTSPDLTFVTFPGEHTPGLLFPCRFDPK